jgi:hypothetical protein
VRKFPIREASYSSRWGGRGEGIPPHAPGSLHSNQRMADALKKCCVCSVRAHEASYREKSSIPVGGDPQTRRAGFARAFVGLR